MQTLTTFALEIMGLVQVTDSYIKRVDIQMRRNQDVLEMCQTIIELSATSFGVCIFFLVLMLGVAFVLGTKYGRRIRNV
jgi:hypothetical protein